MEKVIRFRVVGANSTDGKRAVCVELVRPHEPDQTRGYLIEEALARELAKAIEKVLNDPAKPVRKH